ncbi:MAG TPA: SRPBCC domain-containing protein [Myxococcaceae bacterium]|nr:SRPBCC domain-containing protein [Myxococcaceae bacterium]
MEPLQSNDTRNLVVTRTLDAPPELVWRAWSDGEQVRRWWGPTGFTSPLAQMDFRVGGKSLVSMRAPKEYGGFEMYNTWTYQKIKPYERLEFVMSFSDKDGNKIDPSAVGIPPGVPSEVPHVITLKALGSDKTEMTVTEYGYTSEQAYATSKAGLEQCLDKMAAALN